MINGINLNNTYQLYAAVLTKGDQKSQEQNSVNNNENLKKAAEGNVKPEKAIQAPSTGSNSKTKECKTCKSRKYKDVSSDSGASMQTATSVAPQAAAAMVISHEQGHLHSAEVSAQNKGREVVSSQVEIFTDVCQECGKVYVSGGKATTTTAKQSSNNSGKGLLVDLKV